MFSRRLWLYFVGALVVIVLDQVTKTLVTSYLVYGERMTLIPSFFDVTLVFNSGAAFSFLANAGGWQKYLFLVLALIVSVYLAFAVKKNDLGLWGNRAAALIAGGALGNAADRILHGHVIDFILFYYKDYYYPAFNVADSFIFIGALMLAFDSFLSRKKGAA